MKVNNPKTQNGFKQTDIGLIPEDWQIKSIRELASLKGGKRLPKGNKLLDEKTKFPYIRVTDFNNFSVNLNSLKYLSKDIFDQISRYIITKDDVYISIAGSIGLVGMIPQELDGANLTENAARLVITDEKVINNVYLMYFFSSNVGQKQCVNRSVKNAQPKLALARINNIKVPIPNIIEQKKIAHVLSKIQQAIETQEKIIKTTQELKKALMQKLFTEGLNGEPQKQTEIGPIPESWEVKEFKNYVVLQRGKDLPKYKFEDGDIPVAGSNGIIGYHSSSFVKAPGLTVGRSGSCGVVTFYQNDFWAHNTTLYAKDFKGNYPLFVFYHLQFIDLSRFKSGVSVPTLNRNSFSGLKVPVASITEQKEIAKYLTKVDEKIEFEKHKLNQIKSFFQSSLNKLMTGKIRVKDIEFDIEKNKVS